MTARHLVWMSEGRSEWLMNEHKMAWGRTASLMAMIHNVNCTKQSQMKGAEDFYPFNEGKRRRGIRITPQNVQLLKALVPGRNRK